jgi:hypothetical protein
MSEFRAACRVQARLAMGILRKLWLPRVSTSGAVTKAGCLLLAPFITLMFWTVQCAIWLVISVPVLAYALTMALIGGGIAAKTYTGPPLPPAVASADGTMRTPDGRWVSFDGGNNYISAAAAAAMAPPPPPPPAPA